MSGFEGVWREFESNEITHSGAHYLLAISALGDEGDNPRAVDVAHRLEVSRAAVSLQLKALRQQRLVEVGADHRIRLTDRGHDLVGRIAGKRRVLLAFLRDVLGVCEETAERDACKVEHLVSEESGAALVRLLRFLSSGHPAAAACMAAFRETVVRCRPGVRCDLCDEVCLLGVVEA